MSKETCICEKETYKRDLYNWDSYSQENLYVCFRYDSSICVTWLSHKRRRLVQLMHMCNTSHSCNVPRPYVRYSSRTSEEGCYNSSTCATCLIYMWRYQSLRSGEGSGWGSSKSVGRCARKTDGSQNVSRWARKTGSRYVFLCACMCGCAYARVFVCVCVCAWKRNRSECLIMGKLSEWRGFFLNKKLTFCKINLEMQGPFCKSESRDRGEIVRALSQKRLHKILLFVSRDRAI